MSPVLWQGMKMQDATLEPWSHIPENMEQAAKHWIIAASTGDYGAMYNLQKSFEFGFVCYIRDAINSTLTAYNNSCAEMRSEARDAYIRTLSTHIE
jgi:hypothetical protein